MSEIEREEKVMIVLLMMVLLSLSIAYVTFYQDVAQIQELSTSSRPGEMVYLEGIVASERFTNTGDHLLIDVEHGSETIKVFVSRDKGAKEIASIIGENNKVRVTGEVQEYQGELEIVVQDVSGIELL
ncbi:OB-fold nucleic acid binding domain-containing protein [Methanomethylovorans sp. PtaU1.Bin093]|uniref:OB-fold nucleic acid binding domain-containing protein n=1 Tax=Methanomethylovorans sp. PtaU1.Bin093 TaxID=1811679 RepID=UPI0025EBCF89|nr:OB-fold nucleic acid binding domain-containing protein [Methanomethylovorans sp. PtaU1.Bin093]